jgi:SAM-dependent methyltransferase
LDESLSKIVDFYESGVENDRLVSGARRLELDRTQHLLRRLLPSPPAQVLDVGGGPGRYASWLASRGYSVTLIDPVPLHVQQARERALEHTFAAQIGDARHLTFANETCDVVLLLGPLYHLPGSADRLATLQEAHRVLRHGGVVIAAAISRFASILDQVRRGRVWDSGAALQKLSDGLHREDGVSFAYLHRPDELRAEVEQARFDFVEMLAVEGPFWLLTDLDDRYQDAEKWRALIEAVALIESEATVIGASSHLLATGVKR